MSVVIWSNPLCSRSPVTLDLQIGRGHQPEVRRDLEDPPGEGEIRAALTALGCPPEAAPDIL